MKKKLIIVMGLALMCTGCGATKSDTDNFNKSEGYAEENLYYENAAEGYDYPGEYEYADAEQDVQGIVNDTAADTGMSEAGADNVSHADEKAANQKLNKEMLVYRGDLVIDTLDFNSSVNNFKKMIEDKGGFVESESYTDNYSDGGYYYVEKDVKHNVYYATIRIPSASYNDVMNNVTKLGDVRSRNSNATNVTQQYSTYKSQLEIYETEYSRYLTLLEKAEDDEYALKIENELFDIQIQIANLKAGMTNIENDVAYSYIDIKIKEVTKYEDEPEKTDTFFDRLKNTCSNSWKGFLQLMEDLIFFVIMNIYYIIFILAVVLVVLRFRKKKRGINKMGRKSNKMNMEKFQENINQDKNE